MRGNLTITGSDRLTEDFAAELTEAAYPLALQHGVGNRWLDLELDLWHVLTDTVRNWEKEGSRA